MTAGRFGKKRKSSKVDDEDQNWVSTAPFRFIATPGFLLDVIDTSLFPLFNLFLADKFMQFMVERRNTYVQKFLSEITINR